jgi:perosamine synthetase
MTHLGGPASEPVEGVPEASGVATCSIRPAISAAALSQCEALTGRNCDVIRKVPFFRPEIGDAEIGAVVEVLRSGWLTTGPRVKKFEDAFAAAVHGTHAVAMNSCTAALHVAVHALGLQAGQGVLVPTMTFAATAEVIRYEGGIPLLVDCDPVTLNMDLADAESKLVQFNAGKGRVGTVAPGRVVGMMPVHVGGLMMNMDEINAFASRHDLWVVEDAAHAFPAAWRRASSADWEHCGSSAASVSCFSFYANKTITTGEGGMAVTQDAKLAGRLRLLSLHGLSKDAWNRYSGGGVWDYRILTPGYKYNLTDIAAAIGIAQLERAESMRRERERVAHEYLTRLADIPEIELPPTDPDRVHAWHLFPIRLRLDMLTIDRAQFMEALREQEIATSVHWRPLHLHPYYQEAFGWRPEDLPAASEVWPRLVSLPLYSGMTAEEIGAVVDTVRSVCARASTVHVATM